MRSKFLFLASLALVGAAVSGCRYGHPGHASDRDGHDRGDRDGDRDRNR